MSTTSMPWFRMYVDFLTDPKMISLAFEDQRHYIGVLALKSDGALDNDCDPDLLDRIVAQRLWIDHGVIRDVKRRLVAAGLIAPDWQPIAWNRRQFRSDSSKDRVRAFRDRMKSKAVTGNGDETLQKRSSNVLDTDTDTDTDKEGAKAPLSAGEPSDDVEAAAAGGGDDTDPGGEPPVLPRPSVPMCPHQEVLALFGKHLPELPQPRPELWTGQREKNLAARWRWVLTAKKRSGERYATTKAEGLQFFERYFAYVAKSDFLTGRSGEWGGCDLGWLVKAENFTKVIQGNYERTGGAA